VENVRDNVSIKLSDKTAAELAKRTDGIRHWIYAAARKIHDQVLARDDETGRIGTFQTTFVIPNLNKEVKRVPLSAVVHQQPAREFEGCHLQRRESKRYGQE
jgi:hypothetical protein